MKRATGKSKAAPAGRKIAAALSYHPEKKVSLHRLPFVGGGSCWAVPATGGYVSGTYTGEALAHAYLKHLSVADFTGGTLQLIVLGMCEAHKSMMGADATESFEGQVVGFFSTLDWVLREYARLRASTFSALSEESILKQANAGLAGAVLPDATAERAKH